MDMQIETTSLSSFNSPLDHQGDTHITLMRIRPIPPRHQAFRVLVEPILAGHLQLGIRRLR